MKIANRFSPKLLVLMMSILVAGAGILSAQTDEPGPFQKFFRAMRRGFNEPRHKSTAHQSSHKQQTSETQTSPTPDPNAHATSESTNKPPSDRNTRNATRASAKKGEDLPYGTPVPGKQGFVTSPFSPNSGYIDVRGFVPGTPVKDPYTGKVFLTP
jgi:hypothetical protein